MSQHDVPTRCAGLAIRRWKLAISLAVIAAIAVPSIDSDESQTS
jgi:hypothetical protein